MSGENTSMKWSYTGSSTGRLYLDRRDFYIEPYKSLELWSDVAPFYGTLTKMGFGQKDVNEVDWKMFEHERSIIDNFKFYVNGGNTPTLTAGSETTAITIDYVGAGTDNIVGLQAGYVVEVRSSADVYKCTALVSTYTSATSIKITPLWVDGTKAIADNDIMYIMTSAEEEGGNSVTAWADDLDIVWGSAQITKTSVEVSGTLLKLTKLRGASNELGRLRDEKRIEQYIKMNRGYLFGMRRDGLTTAPTNMLTGANSRGVRTTWGIVSVLRRHGTTDTNKFSRTYATYAWDDFVDDMEYVYKYKNLRGIKIGYCGAGVKGWLSTKDTGILGVTGISANVQFDQVSKEFGWNYDSIRHPFGRLVLVYDPTMRGQYNDTMVIVDPEYVGKKVFRKPIYQTSIQDNDSDSVKDQYMNDEGLGVSLIKAHSFFEFA